jgi:transposase-like protein
MARIASMTRLPLPNERWSARRKAAVVAAVSSGVITIEEACRRYRMSEEEFFSWRRALESYGLLGLRALVLPDRPTRRRR